MKKLIVMSIATIICAITCVVAGTRLHAIPCSINVTLSGDSYDFGSVDVGAAPANYDVTVTNAGTCSIMDIDLTLTGTDPSQFQVTHNCPAIFPASGTCQGTISFTPAAAGSFSAILSVVEALSTYDTMTLTGTGTTPATDDGDLPDEIIFGGNAALLIPFLDKDDSDGCSATASTGGAGRSSSGATLLGLAALMGLVLGTAAVRRRMRKRD